MPLCLDIRRKFGSQIRLYTTSPPLPTTTSSFPLYLTSLFIMRVSLGSRFSQYLIHSDSPRGLQQVKSVQLNTNAIVGCFERRSVSRHPVLVLAPVSRAPPTCHSYMRQRRAIESLEWVALITHITAQPSGSPLAFHPAGTCATSFCQHPGCKDTFSSSQPHHLSALRYGCLSAILSPPNPHKAAATAGCFHVEINLKAFVFPNH